MVKKQIKSRLLKYNDTREPLFFDPSVSSSSVDIDLNALLNSEGGGTLAHMDKSTQTGSFYATTFYASSDERLKENIYKYKTDETILNLQVYKYDFINGEKDQIGCLAQDLEKICPEIVKNDENGFLKIEENKIVFLLLLELQKMRKELDELKNKEK